MGLGGFGIPCGKCGCTSCTACTRTCTNPHSGGAFEAVYTRYFEGVEAGNPSDGYLSASGDSDTSDPYDGMDGTGPWYQQVSGTFTINSTQTRHPCRVTVSFWRNNYTLGAATIPPASTALTSEGVYVTVTSGAVIVGDRVIVPSDGEVEITTISIPLVTGGGDQSGNDPRFYDGSISVAPTCESATFSIRARIDWNTKKRQHVLYGMVRECYEEGTPCATACSGNPSPSVVYVTISNYTGPAYDAGIPMDIEGTYVLDRVPGFCQSFFTYWTANQCPSVTNPLGSMLYSPIAINIINGSPGYYMAHYSQIYGVCQLFEALIDALSLPSICGSGVIYSGTNGKVRVNGVVTSNCFDWEIEI